MRAIKTVTVDAALLRDLRRACGEVGPLRLLVEIAIRAYVKQADASRTQKGGA